LRPTRLHDLARYAVHRCSSSFSPSWLTLALLAYIALLFVVTIDWPAVAKDEFVAGPAGAGAMTVVIAIFGTTISPCFLFWPA
jgi:Mn2+/Fe2+ NRAMP family transporter